ncbi:MAG: serine O-acetyltransferase [Candidatus Margulisbacteria bacterium]|nr:serine O-acetyltransferase [Candidatus Margulisiibacteriota bacterium]
MIIFSIFLASLFLLLVLIAYIHKDIQAIFLGDPAAKNILEVLTYPSLYATSMHRINHLLWSVRIPFIPRLLSQIVRFFTFIEIHPAARIGDALFIDHGDGVVIGETAEIGNNVILYHQVTLGGTGKEKGKRHPTIGNNVIIGAGSKILGNIRIGNNCKIGAGTIVLKNVPDHSTVVGNPGRIVSGTNKDMVESLDLGNVPDPIQENFIKLEKQIKTLQKQVKDLSANKKS